MQAEHEQFQECVHASRYVCESSPYSTLIGATAIATAKSIIAYVRTSHAVPETGDYLYDGLGAQGGHQAGFVAVLYVTQACQY